MISKSLFIRGLQCLKSLYLHKNRPYLRDPISKSTLAKFRRGHEIGKLAQELFPDGIQLARPGPKSYLKSASLVSAHIAQQTPVLYEVPFIHEDFLAIMDILTFQNGTWNAFEVKSSLSISDTYLWDICFQAYVIQAYGLSPVTFSIIHINPEYVLQDRFNPAAFFNIVPVEKEIYQMLPEIPAKLIAMRDTLNATTSPEISVGTHCHYPYPCDFTGHCHKHIKEPSIFSISGITLEEKYQFIEEGKSQLRDVAEHLQNTQIINRIHSILSNQTIIQNREMIEFFGNPPDQVCFIKIFHQSPAIPLHRNKKPFELTPIMISTAENQIHETVFNEYLIEVDERISSKTFHDFLSKMFSQRHKTKICCFGEKHILIPLFHFYMRENESFIHEINIIDLQEIFELAYYCAPDIDTEYSFQSVVRHFNSDKAQIIHKDFELINKVSDDPFKYSDIDGLKDSYIQSGRIWCLYLSGIYKNILQLIDT
jgi:hypothetical protein